MSSPGSESGTGVKKHVPFVPEGMEMKEFTLRAVLLGLLMTIVLGAANAYLGLRAGITIAATYPAAVIAMAAMRAWKGSLLEENIARTAGSIGESVAAGAIFTLPAFVLAKAWPSFRPGDAYWKSTALIMVGSILGVLFISLVRRGMVEDPELPFPESLAASEIHKAGQRGAQAAKYLFWNIGIGGVVYILGKFGLFAADTDLHVGVGSLGHSQVRLGSAGSTPNRAHGRHHRVRGAERESGLSGRGLHHRRQTGVDPICRERAGLGTAGSLDDVFSGTAAQGIYSRRHSRQLGHYGGRGVAIHCASDCRRRNAGRRSLHIVQNACQPDRRNRQGIRGPAADVRQQAKLARTERYMSSKIVFGLIALHVRADVFALHQNLGPVLAGDSGGGGDDSGWISSLPPYLAIWWGSSARRTIRFPD